VTATATNGCYSPPMPAPRLSKPLIVTRPEDDTVTHATVAEGEVVLFSTRSPGKETDSEDGAAVIPVDDERAVLVVADGLGGQRSGAEAAGVALEAMTACVGREAETEAGLRSAVLDGFEQANARVAELAVGAATTLAAVEIDGPTVRAYHVGDSMVLVVGQRGKVKLQTVSHSPVGYAVEAGMIDAKEAIHHEDRHLVSNIVGTPQMRIELGGALRLRPRDTVVLGSDGLFDNLHLEEITEYVRKGPLPRAAGALAGACRQRMCEPGPDHPSKPDDLTFLLYRRRI
jgi:serine/threonine protein phosphatase PrpC